MEAPALAFSLGVLALVIGSAFIFARKPDLRLTAETARRAFLEDYWDCAVDTVTVSRDGSAALLRLAGGGVGVVTVLGDQAVTRRVDEADLKISAREDGLAVRLPMLGWIQLQLGEAEARAWAPAEARA
ncbi:MAG: hypothetical protein RIA71_10065 [Oceanicaulis sp.]